MTSETLYLCNFRVSVDGEWLCLRELGDLNMSPQLQSPAEEDAWAEAPRCVEEMTDDSVIKNPVLVERANLLNVAKLCIKTLIESAMEEARILDDEYVPLQQFFVVMEHVMNHGVKGKKTFLEKKRSFWGAVESLEKVIPDFSEIIDSVRNLPGIKTSIGRGRAWLRLAMMQKKLADYFKAIIEKKDLLIEWYEPTALIMEEEAMVIGGLLVGLNAIDCNFCLKGDDLDSAPSVIDFSMYFKDGNYLDKPMEAASGSPTGPAEVNLTNILDQKNFLEEHNRHLTSQIASLQSRIKALEDANTKMKEELAVANNNILSIQGHNDLLQAENNVLKQHTERKLEIAKADMAVERETYNTSRIGLNEMYTEAKEKLQQETQMRLDVEQELQLQISLKMEMEMAMRLLETDIHEKQDTIISLRKQLDEIKAINIDLYKKIQGNEETMKHKSDLVGKLEDKTNQMVETIKQLEERLRESERQKQAAAETARKLGMQIADRDAKCSNLAADLKVEGEWRATLQKEIAQEKELVGQLQVEIREMSELRTQLANLSGMHEELRRTCHEQELALAEMGSKLSESQLKMDNMKEVVQSTEGRVWADDKDVRDCMHCQKPFSVARRKHHCRNCGGIYCGPCSDNLMPLPSFAKPVRVCDNCHTELLQRYSATSR
ncbi:RUN and FYVE domain-containing protein 2-like [Diadema antillarum]|uniref:RUN and FYVE domain-containing protein 2-like n=1 Tax=Diadema antillarum TaxID=105358 RepID=UPI003A880A78